MSRRYHRHVGGKVERSKPAQRLVCAESTLGGITGPAHIPQHCCPDVMPWDLCEHQRMRKVLAEMRS